MFLAVITSYYYARCYITYRFYLQTSLHHRPVLVPASWPQLPGLAAAAAAGLQQQLVNDATQADLLR